MKTKCRLLKLKPRNDVWGNLYHYQLECCLNKAFVCADLSRNSGDASGRSGKVEDKDDKRWQWLSS